MSRKNSPEEGYRCLGNFVLSIWRLIRSESLPTPNLHFSEDHFSVTCFSLDPSVFSFLLLLIMSFGKDAQVKMKNQ